MAAGIYAIRCMVNGKVYVGSTACITRRWANHKGSLRRNCHDNTYLQFAWNKHGESAFEFILLEECSPADCTRREQFWADQKRSYERQFGYNRRVAVDSNLGIKRSKETCAKIAAVHRGKRLSEEHRKKISETATGRKLGEAWCKAVSDGLKGRKREPFSDAWRKALSDAKKGKPKPEGFSQKVAEANRKRHAANRARRHAGQLSLSLGHGDYSSPPIEKVDE